MVRRLVTFRVGPNEVSQMPYSLSDNVCVRKKYDCMYILYIHTQSHHCVDSMVYTVFFLSFSPPVFATLNGAN